MDKEIRQLIFTASQRKLSGLEYQRLLDYFDENYRFENLKKVIAEVRFGRVEIMIKDGLPMEAEEIRKKIRLDNKCDSGL